MTHSQKSNNVNSHSYSQGRIEAQGTPSDLSKSGVDFAALIETNDESDDNEENPDRPVSRQVSRQMSSRSSNKSLRSLSTSSSKASLQDENKQEEKDQGVGMEESSKGKVKGSISAAYFRAGANWFGLSLLLIFFVISQILASAADYWVSVW